MSHKITSPCSQSPRTLYSGRPIRIRTQAVHHAAAADAPEVLRTLAGAGADINLLTDSGTPLHWAVGEGAERAVAELLALGAAPDVPVRRGHHLSKCNNETK